MEGGGGGVGGGGERGVGRGVWGVWVGGGPNVPAMHV